MVASVADRLDMLLAESLAQEQVLSWLVNRLDPNDRAGGLKHCREIMDALEAHPQATARGRRTFDHAHHALNRIFREPQASAEEPRPDL